MLEYSKGNHGLVLFDPYIRPYQVPPIWAWVDQGAMAMKGCSAFLKVSALQEHNY